MQNIFRSPSCRTETYEMITSDERKYYYKPLRPSPRQQYYRQTCQAVNDEQVSPCNASALIISANVKLQSFSGQMINFEPTHAREHQAEQTSG
ncbi:hypothetical protein PISMIDRAFT_20374 [Pisolithus microcarpus 441]|uniref:Uncharacterized protein n=1 Tax=Pisolithus microcarpus 441 TaxID=765257 RepID=A0A0C9XZY9_9AGAM|nr:hypothetical protein PISMIDRAFT_20374 [Pisolithus microcarpus 441]